MQEPIIEAGRRNQIPWSWDYNLWVAWWMLGTENVLWKSRDHSQPLSHLPPPRSLKRFQLTMSLSRFNPIVSRGLFVLGYLVCLLYFWGTESHHISSVGREHDVLLSWPPPCKDYMCVLPFQVWISSKRKKLQIWLLTHPRFVFGLNSLGANCYFPKISSIAMP